MLEGELQGRFVTVNLGITNTNNDHYHFTITIEFACENGFISILNVSMFWSWQCDGRVFENKFN